MKMDLALLDRLFIDPDHLLGRKKVEVALRHLEDKIQIDHLFLGLSRRRLEAALVDQAAMASEVE